MKYILSLILIVITTVTSAQQGSAVSSNFTLNNKKEFNLSLNESFLSVKSAPSLNESIDIDFPYEVYDGQATRFNGRKNWTLNKKEIRFSIGATQFLGDLGGKDHIGADYRLKDLDWPSTGIAGMFGYRYRFHNLFATTTSLYIGLLRGDDKYTGKKNVPVVSDGIFRYARNLSFRAPFIDISQRLDFMIYLKEKVGKRYNIRGLKGFKNRNEQVFLFAGVGVIGFISQGKYEGKWYNLRPLSTEGQGLVGSNGVKKHLPVTITVPMGIGFRVGISREWRIGIETSYVKTFSDYIDDVHGVYFDKNLLAQQKGPIAAALSNRSIDTPEYNQWYAAGQQRGDKQKDSYYYLNVILTKNVTYRNYTKTHRHFKLTKGKYKF